MNITEIAIDKNRITAVSLVIILLAGVGAYFELPRAEDPGFIVRAATVMTFFPGASPRRMEELVTDKLEEAIREMPEIDFIESESKTGFSLITVNILETYTEMRPIWDSLRRKVDAARPQLPDGVQGPFVNDEYGDVFGTIVALTGDGYSYAELEDVAKDVRDELLLIDEVAKVEIIGLQDERVFVEYDDSQLAEMGVSPLQLVGLLESRNIIIPGGAIDEDMERIVLEPTGNFDSVDDLRRTIVQLPGVTDLLELGDITSVERGYPDPPEAFMRSSGVPALGLALSLREGGNIIDMGDAVQATVTRLQGYYPIGLEFEFVAFQPYFVNKKVSEFTNNLLQAVLIVLAVMLVSLGLRTGFVVASLIPMAIVSSLLVMSMFGIGLDQMSLASLIIALGMLVDNSIVMSESIMVLMNEGKTARRAALDSAKELRVPLLTSSLTTAAAFLPIFLAESTTGEYTAPLFKVVTITLLCSWLLSLTMIPLLSVALLRPKKGASDDRSGGFYAAYRRALSLGLRFRWLSLGVVAAIFIGVMNLAGYLPQIFFPPNDKPIFTVELELPVGTRIGQTAAAAERIEALLDEYRQGGKREAGPADGGQLITTWMTFIGESAPRFILSFNPKPARPEYAMLVVNGRLDATRDDLNVLMQEIEQVGLEVAPDAVVDVKFLPLGPPNEAPIEIRLSGKDEDLLFDIVDEARQELTANHPVKNVRDDWGQRTKKLEVAVNQARARRAGLTNEDVAISLQGALSGIETTEYRESDDLIPVILRSTAADRQDVGKLETLNIFSQTTGRPVPLKQVADVEVEFQPAKILRRDGLKTVTLRAFVADGVSLTPIAVAQAFEETWLKPNQAQWGVGYKYGLGGEVESSGKANASITAKLPIAMFIIVLLLVGQFNSIRRPAIILLTIPLGLVGVILGLLGTGSYFGFMTLLGVISLAGIVINNAIVLIERIDLEIRDNGLDPPVAIVEAATRRLRPILLTTATTIGGLIPLWLGGGPMWEPMAIAIIFGLAFATVLTLGVVPVLYSIFFRVSIPPDLGRTA